MDHKILCIDDETHNLEALERLLRKKYTTVIASSGAEALEKLKEHQFSLIISDQKMPEMTGVQFFMQAKEIQPEAIRILLTGYTDLESVIGAINEGQIYRYITKPWEPEEFLNTTRQAIEIFEMKNTIREQNAQLQRVNKELKGLDQMKSDFMMLVNHELKTPLTGIYSFVQLLREENLAEEHKLYVSKIEKNTQRLQDLINDTLLITKLKTQSDSMDKESVLIGDVVKHQWQDLQKEFSSMNLKLNLSCPNNFEQVINRKYIAIIVKKLLHNSFSHAAADTTVNYSLSDEGDFWKIQTQNQLVNELEKTPEELLSAFTTSENVLNHTAGTGLGLAVIQAIVNLFGGNISIKSQKKQFELTIEIPK